MLNTSFASLVVDVQKQGKLIEQLFFELKKKNIAQTEDQERVCAEICYCRPYFQVQAAVLHLTKPAVELASDFKDLILDRIISGTTGKNPRFFTTRAQGTEFNHLEQQIRESAGPRGE